MKLVIAVESVEHRCWLQAFDFEASGVETLECVLDSNADGPIGFAVSHATHPTVPDLDLPSFEDLVRGLREHEADACLVFGDGPLARLVTTAADLLGVSIFTLVETEERLANLGRREKERPDLFFIASAALLPRALEDERYGATLIPTGHPARDLLSEDGGGVSREYADERWGDGHAADRILAALERWAAGSLDSREPDLTIIVPAFEEADNLPLVSERLLSAFANSGIQEEIILVDDSSPDDTYRVAVSQMWRSPRIRAVSKPPPRGMGNAIRHGLALARAQRVAITMGDGSDDVDRIPEMLHKVRDEGYALAIGSRYRHRKNYEEVPRIYRFWSACFRLCARALIGLKLSDYTNAFRLFDRRIFTRYGPESGGFEISPEITFKAWFAARGVTEVDVRHLKRASGQSSFSFLRAGPGYAKILTKAFIHRLTGRWFTLDW